MRIPMIPLLALVLLVAGCGSEADQPVNPDTHDALAAESVATLAAYLDVLEQVIDEQSARVQFTEQASIWVSSGNALSESGFEGSGRRPPSVVVVTYRRPHGDGPVLDVNVTAYAPDAEPLF